MPSALCRKAFFPHHQISWRDLSIFWHLPCRDVSLIHRRCTKTKPYPLFDFRHFWKCKRNKLGLGIIKYAFLEVKCSMFHPHPSESCSKLCYLATRFLGTTKTNPSTYVILFSSSHFLAHIIYPILN